MNGKNKKEKREQKQCVVIKGKAKFKKETRVDTDKNKRCPMKI
jgi:hypothetical protein